MCMPDYCQEHCDMSLDEAIADIHNAPGKYFKIGAHVVSNCRKFDLDVFCLLITCTYIYFFFQYRRVIPVEEMNTQGVQDFCGAHSCSLMLQEF